MHFKIKPSMMGYDVKDGRLINNAPPLTTGIDRAVMLKNSLKRAKKVQMIAEGNELANANINLFKKL
jgi:hypothetical protein